MTGLLTMSSSENSSMLNLSSGSGTSQTHIKNFLSHTESETSERLVPAQDKMQLTYKDSEG